jgi:hypothetical protein
MFDLAVTFPSGNLLSQESDPQQFLPREGRQIGGLHVLFRLSRPFGTRNYRGYFFVIEDEADASLRECSVL